MKFDGFLLLILQATFAVSVESFADNCTRKCSVMDSNLENCWDQSLDYFTEALVGALNSYASSLIHIDRWKTRHPDEAAKYEQFESDSLDRVMSKYGGNEDLVENGPLNQTLLRQIIMEVMNMTDKLKPTYADEGVYLPSYSCPIPCDYYPKIWMALFFVMFTICILTVISILAYFCVNTHQKVPQGFKQIYKFSR